MLFQSIAVLATAALSFRISAASLGVSNEFTPTRAKREIPSTHGLHELQDNHWLARWTKRSKVPEGSLLPMRIGLVQQNLEAGALRLSEM
jgi:tripeptidyl-peptidase-1